jgi:hypothetical protein
MQHAWGGEKRNAHRVLVGQSDGKRPLETCRRRWKDNIKMDLGEIVWDGMDWTDFIQDSDQPGGGGGGAVEHGN